MIPLFPYRTQKFNELWRNIEALQLPHLTRVNQKESFNPVEFYKKLGWAHAELSVALNLIDMLISGKTLAIQPVSVHPDSRPSTLNAFNDTIKTTAQKLKESFKKAASDMKIDEDMGLIEKVLQLKMVGWPVFKIGLDWAINFDYKFIKNMPQNPERLAFLSYKDDEFVILTAFTPKFLVFYDEAGRAFSFASHQTDKLWKLMLSTLDLDLFKGLNESKFTAYKYDLISDIPAMIDAQLPPGIRELYRNFIK